jgi:hypothetical protein
MKALRFFGLLCLPLVLSSCKFSADFVKRLCPEPGSSVTETIGSAGGSLELEDDEGRQVATLEIPPGALEADTSITLSREPSGYARLGDLVSISTDAVSFAKPIVLTLDYSALAASSGLAAEDIGVYCYAEATGLYPIIGAQADSSTETVSIKFTHLGVQVASASKAAGSASVRRRGAGQETTAIPGPIYVELTDQDRETINELTGGGLTAELIAAMDEVWLCYHNGNTNPASETSFEQGAEAVRSLPCLSWQ